jgi:hypothetical protein
MIGPPVMSRNQARKLLVTIGVTNRGGCASSQSSGSPLVLGNLKLREEALLVGRKNQYLCTVEIKPIPPVPAFGRSLFVYALLPFAVSGISQAPILVAVGLCLPVPVRLCLLVPGGLGVRGLGVFVYACFTQKQYKNIASARWNQELDMA